MSRLAYFFRESLQSSRRNIGTTIGGTLTIFLCLVMVGISILISVIIGNVLTSVEEDVDIRLYVADDATDEQIEEFDGYLDSLTNDEGNIASVTLMNKDEVMEEFRNSTANSFDIADTLDENPLPRTYVIELVDQEQVEDTANNILGNESFLAICDSPDNPSDSIKYGQGTVQRLFLIVNLIRYACIAFVILLVFISLVFLNNTIRLAILARRREISIMRLVGASNGFIRGPFIMEGALQALVGAILAIIVLVILRVTAIPSLSDMINWLPLEVAGSVYTVIYIVLILGGLLIGILGSAIAMRRYLKV